MSKADTSQSINTKYSHFPAGVVTPHAIAHSLNFLMGSYGHPIREDDTTDDSVEIGQFTSCPFMKHQQNYGLDSAVEFATRRIQLEVILFKGSFIVSESKYKSENFL